MKAVFLDALTLGNIDLQRFDDIVDTTIYPTTSKDQVIARLCDADIALTNKVIIDKEVIDNTNLKMIQVLATGMNNIDVAYAESKNIVVKNVCGYSTNSVAQLTFAMVLSLLNKLPYYDKYTKTEYSKSDIFTHIIDFHELYNKKWGIIGLGNIGQRVASIAQSFGCDVLYYSTSSQNNNPNFTRTTLHEVLECDIISIHAPLNKNTHNLINKDNLHLIKKDAILINVGRGGIVNEQDLADVIDKQGFYAGFDVFSQEPIDPTNPLLHVKNVILTPHIAWASIQAREKLITLAYNQVKEFVENYNLS
ncbi:MAG: D-2-hydroxyacid dehydrogenase [Epsilonproteobacteria bacterium]|nr:D-2-hydroxyacid dehydrogenase [Campylobacterota bacterium]